jgi:uncharacterized membrane protein
MSRSRPIRTRNLHVRAVFGGFAAIVAACVLAGCGKPADKAGGPESTVDPAVISGAPGTGGSSTASAVAAAGVPASVDTTSWVVAPPFYAAGEEPYWRMELADGWFVFERSGLPPIEAPIVQPTKGAKGADVFKASPLEVQIAPGECLTDSGLSGAATISVAFDGVAFDGCVFKQGGSTADNDNFEPEDVEAIAEAVPEIDACLTKLGEAALVTAVYPRQPGVTAMALRAKNGSLYECASNNAGEVQFLDPVEPGAAGAWMSSHIRFLRSGGDAQAAAKSCAGAKEVLANEGGAVVGYLLKPSCKF